MSFDRPTQRSSPQPHAALARARRCVAAAACALALLVPTTGNAIPSYMSYFGLGWNVAETQDHVNLHWVVSWRWDAAEVLDQLRDAKRRGMRALVHTEFVFFDGSGTYANSCPYALRPDAAARWDAFARTLAAEGLLDTVAAFYPVDEPDLCGLPPGDVLGVLGTIRAQPLTAGRPIAAIFTCEIARRYGGIYRYTGGHKYGEALRAYDWVGFDCYGSPDIFSEPAWTTPTFDVRCFCVRQDPGPSYFDNFKAQLDLARQRVMLVPQGFVSGERDGAPDDPQRFAEAAAADPAVILIAPFTWFDQPFYPGVRSQPALALAWRNIGWSISSANPPSARPALPAAAPPRLRVAATDVAHFSVFDLSCNGANRVPCAVELDWHAANQGPGVQLFVRMNGGAPVLVTCAAARARVELPWIVEGNAYAFDLYQAGACAAAPPAGATPVASLRLTLEPRRRSTMAAGASRRPAASACGESTPRCS